MDKKKIFWWLGGGVTYDSDYQALLTQATSLGYTLPSVTLRTKQNTLVTSLKSAGVWTIIDVLYVFRNNDTGLGNFALLNWKAPTLFACTLPVAPTYTVNGYDGNGSTQYLSTNWTPSTDGVNYQLTDASMFGYQHENVQATAALWGASGAGGINASRMITRNASDNNTYAINNSTGDNYNHTNATGFWQPKRTASNAEALFKNGSSVDTNTVGAALRPTSPVTLLAYNVNGSPTNFNGSTIGCYGAGASMSSQQSSDLYTAFNTYFSSL